MGYEYRIKDQFGVYFIAFRVSQWVDVFTKKAYFDTVLESLGFCQKENGLKIDAWVEMSNHVHLVIRTDRSNLSDIIRDFKNSGHLSCT